MSGPVLPSYLRTKIIPHAQKLDALEFRYEAVLLRARFEENKNVNDPVKAKKLLEDGWNELKNKKFAFPYLYPTSPGGVAYERYDYKMPDYMLDMWHPLEKNQYPDYFARREKRKADFIEQWKKRYGDTANNSH